HRGRAAAAVRARARGIDSAGYRGAPGRRGGGPHRLLAGDGALAHRQRAREVPQVRGREEVMSAFFLGHPKETDLALFAGGEAGPLARWRIERHVESCERCQTLVADFFHLESELSALAELPDVDWNRLAESIEARLADARASGAPAEPRRAVPAWGLGLAAACA